MRETWDAVVVGLGALGSATAAELAARGHDVVGLDPGAPADDRRSSAGESRLIRRLYFEGPLYVPLLDRAYRLWRDLEATRDRPLLEEVGGLMVGPPEGELISGCRRSGETHGLAYEELAPPEVGRRYPAASLPEGTVGLVDPRAGFLHADACLEALRQEARGHGARLVFGRRVEGWRDDADGVRVEADGRALETGSLVLAAGAWMPDLAPGLDLPLDVERQTLHWFRPDRPASFRKERLPVFLYEREPGLLLYGTPTVGEGVKAGIHHHGEAVEHPDRIEREVREEETARVHAGLREWLPGLPARAVRTRTCFYANTPDERFLVGTHPGHRRVVLLGGGSGHGFKFAPVLAELAADLVEDRPSDHDTSPFRPGRFD